MNDGNTQDGTDSSPESPVWDLDSPELYLNRELTWIEFNGRVLHEAADPRTPLLERLKFLAIVSGNFDEFFMKRIGGLMQQEGAGLTKRSVDGRTPGQQILECQARVRELEARKEQVLLELMVRLEAHDIRLLAYADLTPLQEARVRERYFNDIFPLMTPQAIDPAHPFPFISNLSLNLLVHVRLPDKWGTSSLTRIKVPVGGGVPRFMRVDEAWHFVPMEQVVAHNLGMLLPGVEVLSVACFRVTRNAITESNEEQADDLLAMIEAELRERRFAPIVRLEVTRCMPEAQRGLLAAELGINARRDLFEAGPLLALRDLFELAALPVSELRDPPHEPMDHALLHRAQSLFYAIRDDGPFLLQHPYESFANSVERLLREAAEDPKVRAIKMTLYRTSGESKVVDYLVQAAENGKQVTVVVELKARFDEAANIRWASHLEQAGVHVTYGVVGLKTHSKIILVVRQDFNGIQRYLHIGTGNYHGGTARLYCDLGLLTNDEQIAQDATELFNFLTTGYTPQRNYKKLLPSPGLLKRALLAKIERERRLHAPERPGLIQFKMNALEDADITRALYEASRDGVRVDLIVRDSCRFRPGLPGLSESARVLSLVDRFLEHTRIYYFQNGGAEEYYIGSADCMKRNLEYRVEVVTPVEAPTLQALLRQQLDAQLRDYRSAWEMQPDGSYRQRQPRTDQDRVSAQQWLIEQAGKRLKRSGRELKRQPKHREGRGPRDPYQGP